MDGRDEDFYLGFSGSSEGLFSFVRRIDMLTISKTGDQFVARCGSATCLLPIVERKDELTGHQITEFLSTSGIRGLFRTAVDVTFVPRPVVDEGGKITTTYVPKHRIYDDLTHLLVKLANDKYGHALTRVSRMSDRDGAARELRELICKAAGQLCRERWDCEESTSYETYASSYQAVVLGGPLPRINGRFQAEVDTYRKLEAGKALVKAGRLSSVCATGTGSPGSSYYLAQRSGYTVTELANPLVHEMPEKRRGVVNAVKNAVEILGEEPSPVWIEEVDRIPPMTSAVVVCLPMALDDSVIISESLSQRLTAKVPKSNWHSIDGVINYRGGFRSAGRNGRLVKRASEWPVRLQRTETLDGDVQFTPRQPDHGPGSAPANPDAVILRALREEYAAKYSGMIERLGADTPEESKCWRQWLGKQTRWTERHPQQPQIRRYAAGIDRVDIDGNVMYREDLGISYRRPEIGMKIQSDGDLFKGVVSKILPDEKMPLVRLAGKMVRAEVVCEMNGGTQKHGSLRFAHGQIALYALARHLGGIGIVGQPTVEQIADLAVQSGVYENDDLTCEVFDATGAISYGTFPAGVTRVCRHRQDPSAVSAVKGHRVEKPWGESNTVRSGGCVNGIADTACMLAAGLTECARELRHEIPANTMLKLELLRNAIR